MLEWIADPESWIALGTLVALEIVLGIDNIIFISIIVGRLPEQQRDKARKIGIGFAMLTRLCLLVCLVWIMGLTEPWFSLFGHGISGRNIILLGGGLFLLAKSTHEIHNSLEIIQETEGVASRSSFWVILIQIGLLDIVFSLDSVITAVGLVQHIAIMMLAIVIAVGVMLYASTAIGNFVDSNPTIKMLAMSFLLLIGVTLIAEGFDVHVPKGYIYFAMAFSVCVELLNIRVRKNKGIETIRLTRKTPDT